MNKGVKMFSEGSCLFEMYEMDEDEYESISIEEREKRRSEEEKRINKNREKVLKDILDNECELD